MDFLSDAELLRHVARVEVDVAAAFLELQELHGADDVFEAGVEVFEGLDAADVEVGREQFVETSVVVDGGWAGCVAGGSQGVAFCDESRSLRCEVV